MTTTNELMAFDHVVEVLPDGSITDGPPGVHAPTLVMGCAEDGSILAHHEADYVQQAKDQGWDLLSCWTGQDRYHGVCMHSSEFIGGALETHILATPGLWVVLTVDTADGQEPESWALAYRHGHLYSE